MGTLRATHPYHLPSPPPLPQNCTFALSEPSCYTIPRPPTSYLGAHHTGKEQRSITRRTSLISSRRTRALRERPANDTHLLPLPFPTRRWKVHRLYAAHPSLGSLPHLRLLYGALSPGHTPGVRPDTIGSPEATAPRLDSPVALLGTPLPHGDGKEDTPDPIRTVESVWGSFPFQDSPILLLGDSHLPRDGRESALPSLRMVERLPHTDRPQRESPFSPVDLRFWHSLAPQPLRPGHGPSIAPSSPSPSFPTPIGLKVRQGVNPSLGWGVAEVPLPVEATGGSPSQVRNSPRGWGEQNEFFSLNNQSRA